MGSSQFAIPSLIDIDYMIKLYKILLFRYLLHQYPSRVSLVL